MSFKIYTGQGDGSTPPSYYKGPKASAVNIEDEESLEYWAKSLEVSRAELIEAVKLYGNVVQNIRRGLIQNKKSA